MMEENYSQKALEASAALFDYVESGTLGRARAIDVVSAIIDAVSEEIMLEGAHRKAVFPEEDQPKATEQRAYECGCVLNDLGSVKWSHCPSKGSPFVGIERDKRSEAA